MAEELDAQWEIKVSVPMRLPAEQRQELFTAVVRAVEEWEPAPAERDGWDADVAGCPAAEWPELVTLKWLHAEASYWLQLSRDEHEVDEVLHSWSKRVAYLEARVGELHNTIGELRAESANRLEVGDRLGWRLVEAEQEIERLRREVKFHADGADTFSGADAVAGSLSVSPEEKPQSSPAVEGGDTQ